MDRGKEKQMDQIIIRVETYSVSQYWPDTLAYETRPSGKFQCRLFRGPTCENRMIASGPWRDSRATADADALYLRAGTF